MGVVIVCSGQKQKTTIKKRYTIHYRTVYLSVNLGFRNPLKPLWELLDSNLRPPAPKADSQYKITPSKMQIVCK